MEARISQVLACALHDSMARVVTNVPGTGVSGVYDSFCALAGQPRLPSFNEEVAKAGNSCPISEP